MCWPGCGLRRQVPCRRRLQNPQRPQGRRVDAVYLILLRLPGCGPRRQAPCRRRLQNPQRPQGVASLTFSCKAWSCQGAERASKPQNWACQALRLRGVTCAHASPLRLKQGNQQREKRDRQKVLVLGVRSCQLGQAPRVTRMQKLSTAQEGIHKAPCAWRTPPPSRGRSPYYPYAKVISGAKSGPPCTPPHPGQAPLLPVCKSYQQRTKRPP